MHAHFVVRGEVGEIMRAAHKTRRATPDRAPAHDAAFQKN